MAVFGDGKFDLLFPPRVGAEHHGPVPVKPGAVIPVDVHKGPLIRGQIPAAPAVGQPVIRHGIHRHDLVQVSERNVFLAFEHDLQTVGAGNSAEQGSPNGPFPLVVGGVAPVESPAGYLVFESGIAQSFLGAAAGPTDFRCPQDLLFVHQKMNIFRSDVFIPDPGFSDLVPYKFCRVHPAPSHEPFQKERQVLRFQHLHRPYGISVQKGVQNLKCVLEFFSVFHQKIDVMEHDLFHSQFVGQKDLIPFPAINISGQTIRKL